VFLLVLLARVFALCGRVIGIAAVRQLQQTVQNKLPAVFPNDVSLTAWQMMNRKLKQQPLSNGAASKKKKPQKTPQNPSPKRKKKKKNLLEKKKKKKRGF